MSSEKSAAHAHHAHRSGHNVHQRHHSGRHENGHGHGSRRPLSPNVLDEEDTEDVGDFPTRAHVDVHNAEQFWAGKLGPQHKSGTPSTC